MQFVTAISGSAPLILDSPHSGTNYPADFQFSCDFETLRRAEDTHIERLYAFASELGAEWIEAHFPRSYLDVNRDVTELDLTLLDGKWPGPVADGPKVRLGKGLIWRMTDDGIPIYSRRLTVEEVSGRIERCWEPYHAAVALAVYRAKARHGYCIHINCHSMPSVAGDYATDFPGVKHPDFVVGNRDHTTSSRALAEMVCDHLTDAGYEVALNHPYKGVELVRRYGMPAEDQHSLQLEVNRKLYMNEETLQVHDGFSELQRQLRRLMGRLVETDPRRL